MSELSIEEGMQAFCNDMEREIKEGWGKWLTDDEYDAVMQALTSFAAEELEFLEKAWCVDNPDRLEIQIRGFIDDILQQTHSRVNAFTMADGIADTSANIFNQIKLSIGDSPGDDPNLVTVDVELEKKNPGAINMDGNAEENGPADTGGFVEFIIGTDDVDFQVYYPRVNSDEFVGEEDEMEIEMGSRTLDENIQRGVETEDHIDNNVSRPLTGSQRGDSENMELEVHGDADHEAGSKGKGKTRRKRKSRASSAAQYKTYDLCDLVMDPQKPNGPPTHYRCKIASCNGFQGKWKSRKSHFEARHPEEWFAATGQRQKVFECDVEGCGWSTRHGRSYLRKHIREKHDSGAAAESKE